MSNLVSNYEISFWEDVFNIDGTFTEEKRFVIGANDLLTQSRALFPHLKRNVNGANEFSFEMYYRYVDNITGEEVENPFVRYLNNESKIKLKYQDKWYDFIIKNIQEDSANKIFKYQLTDQHVQELSKNGYGLILDVEKGNNIGTVEELGNRIFDGTGWEVGSEGIPQKTEESLIEIKFDQEFTLKNVVQLSDKDTVAPGEGIATELKILGGKFIDGQKIDGQSIYVFYSTLKSGADRFQFFYFGDNAIIKNGDRLIQNKNCQYYIDGVRYSESADDNLQSYGLKFPNILDGAVFEVTISHEYRGERYVFAHNVLFNNVLNRYVTEYLDDTLKDKNGDPVKWHEYTETKYEAPILIQNLISNTDFKTTTGWTGQYFQGVNGAPVNNVSRYGAKREVDTQPNIMDTILDGRYPEIEEYVPYLKATFSEMAATLINSGPFDNRKKIKNFSPGDKFVLLWDCLPEKDTSFTEVTTEDFLDYFDIIIGEREYDVQGNCYKQGNTNILKFDNSLTEKGIANIITGKDKDKNDIKKTYGYAIASVDENYKLSKQGFLAKKIQLFFIPKKIGTDQKKETVLRLKDFQLFPYIYSDNAPNFLTPETQSTETKVITEYYYFNPDDSTNVAATSEKEMIITKTLEKKNGLQPSYREGAEKSVTISVKQSNYFNAAQTLAETAGCWADFIVTHDEEGRITEKKVYFKNYIGQDNYAGFRYGVNLKSIQRTINSKSIVSKLIVPDITNEYANNGFCSIGRAGSNETGETFIYDFTHYIRHQQLDYDALSTVLYGPKGNNIEDPNTPKGPDITENWTEQNGRNINGYYFRLGKINAEMDEVSTAKASHTKARLQAEADLQIAKAGVIKSAEEHETAAIDFLKLAGYEYTNASGKGNEIKNSKELSEAFTKVTTYEVAHKNYQQQELKAQELVDEYKAIEKDYQDRLDTLKEWKKYLNDTFSKRYRRFIQEGTWNKQDSIDDEKYYLEAKSVAYTSAQPQISYSISIISLDGIEGYENFNFQLADKTYMEDEEYFGYNEDGTPYREEVVLTEINYYLDQPEKTTIKVQNYKNQFQDLFQRITASVQTVNYASGAWQSAADFMQSTKQDQAAFLTDALNNAEVVLQNAGDQSVIMDNEGITVIDLSSPDQKLRIVGGAIMMGSIDENGQEKWSIGMTAQGINAKTITTGRLNTGEVIIMSGNQPTFRWDSYGITAFSFDAQTIEDTGEVLEQNYNFNKGVRFDRFGIYGYEEKGTNWAPKTVNDVKENSAFALTWDGLSIRPGTGYYNVSVIKDGTTTETIFHKSSAILGKTNGKVYNEWDGNTPQFIPQYDEDGKFILTPTFAKILTIETGGNENLAIYDDGTLVANRLKLNVTNKSNAVIFDADAIAGTVKIGGWNVTNNTLQDATGTIVLSPSNNIVFKAGSNFSVSKTGILSCSHANFSGNITSATITASSFQNIDGKFSLSKTGIIANSGSIAGWSINDNSITNGKVGLYVNKEVKILGEKTGKGANFVVESTDTTYSDASYTTTLHSAEIIGNDCLYTFTLGKEPIRITSIVASVIGQGGVKVLSYSQSGKNLTIWFELIEYNTDTQVFVSISYMYSVQGTTFSPSFVVFTDGSFYAQKGHIGSEDATDGILKIAQQQTMAGGDITTLDTTSYYTTFFQSGATEALNLEKIRGGLVDNDFYFGRGGLIFHNPLHGSSAPQSSRGMRVSSSGIYIEGSGRTSFGNMLSVHRGNSLEFYKIGNQNSDSFLFNDEVENNLTEFGRIEIAPQGVGVFQIIGKTVPLELQASSIELEASTEISLGGAATLALSAKGLGGSGTSTVVNYGSITINKGFNEGDVGVITITSGRDITIKQGDNGGIYIGNTDLKDGIQRLYGAWHTMGFHTFHANTTFGTETTNITVSILGNLKLNGNTITTSDLNAKNSIQSLSTQYEQIFDSIQPTSFKYNDGTSNRTHVGVIAQDVEQAILNAGLTTQDCAIVCYNVDEATGEKKDYGVRYSEIIPLNTWQIQKLKPRMTAAEAKIQSLENEIISLKSELKNLKNSQNFAII